MQWLTFFVAVTIALPGITSAQGSRLNSDSLYKDYNGYPYNNTLPRSASPVQRPVRPLFNQRLTNPYCANPPQSR